jgi:MFS family permease
MSILVLTLRHVWWIVQAPQTYPQTMTPAHRPFRGPWIIAGCFVTFGVASGFPYYNIAFFFDYFRNDFGWTQQAITLGAPLAVLLTIWAGPIVVPRWSPRWLIVAGTGLTFLAFEWFAHLGGSRAEYYAAWCVYMLGYFLSGPIPHQIILSHWYKKRRGRAMGIAYVGGALLGALGNLLNPWLVTFLPYTRALEISGFVLLLAWPIAIFVLRDRPEDVGQTPDGLPVDAAEPPIPLQPFGTLLSQRSFWLLLLGSAASIGSIATVNFLMKFVFEEQGFTDQTLRNQIWSTASSTALVAAIAGRILVGQLADRWPRRPLMLAIYALVAIAIPMLFLVTPAQPGYVYLFGIVFGFAMGADYMLIPLMAADLFGLRSLGRAMSAILPADTVTQFWFPNLIAQLRAAWGGYGSALWVACLMAGLGAIAIAALPGKRLARASSTSPVRGRVPEHEGRVS